jgi:nitrous oxidase accessory protein
MANWGRAAAGILLLSFAASGAFVESASAATVTVKKGDDLQAAIDGAMNGDTIVVKAGTYGAVSLTGRTDLTIKGRGKVIVNGAAAQNCLALTNCQNITITGVTFQDSLASAVLGISCEHVTLRGCTVLNAGHDGVDFSRCRFMTLEHNTVDTTQDDGISVSDGSGDQSSQCVITKNRISHVPVAGIEINGNDDVVSKNQIRDSKLNGVLVASGGRSIVEKNKIQNIDGVGIAVHGFGAGAVRGNIVLKPTKDGIDVETELTSVTENVLTKAGQAGIQADVGNNEITKNRITKSGTFDLRDTTGGATNTYVGNKAKTLDPPTLPNPKH